MYSDSESDDEQIKPVNKSDSDFDFIAQGDENDGELDFDAELSLFEGSPLGSQSQSMEIRRENYENALELATANVQLKTELEMTKAENSRLTQEREEKKGSNHQIIKLKQEVKELKKKMAQQKETDENRSLLTSNQNVTNNKV